MQITQEKFKKLFDKLGMTPSATKLEWILADLGVTITKKLIINGVECTQPQRKPLEHGEQYFIANSTSDNMYSGAFNWKDDPPNRKWLERGLVYLNKEDAIKVATALLIPLKGADDEIPELNEDERYAGIIIDSATGQPTHHLILIPQQPAERLSWDKAMAWAASIGAELPTRQESALLYANLKPAFEPTWYWTGEQHAGYASFAWTQYFDLGTQFLNDKGYEGRVRAIRRVPITEN